MARIRYRHLLLGKFGPSSGEGDDRVRELDGVEDGWGTAEEIAELIRAGRLAPCDLVDRGSGWETIEDCEPFEAACAPILRREKVLRALRFSAYGLGFVMLLVITNYGPLAAWLTPSRIGAVHGLFDTLLVLAVVADLLLTRRRRRLQRPASR